MSAPASLALLRASDELYRSVVEDPEAWSKTALAIWAEDVMSSSEVASDREFARLLGRVIRRASRLQRLRLHKEAPDDWRAAVDEELGGVGWRPGLDLATSALNRWPDPELFDEVRFRFRLVHFAEWMDGIEYDEWLAGRGPGSDNTEGG